MCEVVVATAAGRQVRARRRGRLGSRLADGRAIIRGADSIHGMGFAMARPFAHEGTVRALSKSVALGDAPYVAGAEFFVDGGLSIA